MKSRKIKMVFTLVLIFTILIVNTGSIYAAKPEPTGDTKFYILFYPDKFSDYHIIGAVDHPDSSVADSLVYTSDLSIYYYPNTSEITSNINFVKGIATFFIEGNESELNITMEFSIKDGSKIGSRKEGFIAYQLPATVFGTFRGTSIGTEANPIYLDPLNEEGNVGGFIEIYQGY